jgi:hypothetical protein
MGNLFDSADANRCPICGAPGATCSIIPTPTTASPFAAQIVVLEDVWVDTPYGRHQIAVAGDMVDELEARDIEAKGGTVQRPSENKTLEPQDPATKILTPEEAAQAKADEAEPAAPSSGNVTVCPPTIEASTAAGLGI